MDRNGKANDAQLMSLIGGVIILGGSIVFTTVVFPNYFEEIRALAPEMLKKQGLSDAEVAAQMETLAKTQTPFWQAFFGFIGTLVTGVVVSLVIAAFVRKKGDGGTPSAEPAA